MNSCLIYLNKFKHSLWQSFLNAVLFTTLNKTKYFENLLLIVTLVMFFIFFIDYALLVYKLLDLSIYYSLYVIIITSTILTTAFLYIIKIFLHI